MFQRHNGAPKFNKDQLPLTDSRDTLHCGKWQNLKWSCDSDHNHAHFGGNVSSFGNI